MPDEEKCLCTEVKDDVCAIKTDVKEIKKLLLGEIENGMRKPGLLTIISIIKAQQKLMWGILAALIIGGVALKVFGG